MYSLRELYRIGMGPSSSHTIGPSTIARMFREEYPDMKFFKVFLFGSLGATGKGHFTDKAIETVLAPHKVEFVWQPEVVLTRHTNAMRIEGFKHESDKKPMCSKLYYSIGGGAVIEDGKDDTIQHVYPDNRMRDIQRFCNENNISLPEYVEKYEGVEIWDFCKEIWDTMNACIDRGLNATQKYLPAALLLERKAPRVFKAAMEESNPIVKNDALASAFALAVSEENASMGVMVTAPTCGSAGVLPGVLRYAQEVYNLPEETILKGLAVAGIIGLLAKHNASLSGAEVGCQGEIGVSTSMAAAAMCYFLGGTTDQIERAAEIAMEHSLGLTCDPIGGFVMIPCIERNANATLRAIHTASYAKVLAGSYRISYDEILHTMYETGLDMNAGYKETSIDGLAKYYDKLLDEDMKRREQLLY